MEKGPLASEGTPNRNEKPSSLFERTRKRISYPVVLWTVFVATTVGGLGWSAYDIVSAYKRTVAVEELMKELEKKWKEDDEERKKFELTPEQKKEREEQLELLKQLLKEDIRRLQRGPPPPPPKERPLI